jgi:hypothetical protein
MKSILTVWSPTDLALAYLYKLNCSISALREQKKGAPKISANFTNELKNDVDDVFDVLKNQIFSNNPFRKINYYNLLKENIINEKANAAEIISNIISADTTGIFSLKLLTDKKLMQKIVPENAAYQKLNALVSLISQAIKLNMGVPPNLRQMIVSAILKNKPDYADTYINIFEAVINAKKSTGNVTAKKLIGLVNLISEAEKSNIGTPPNLLQTIVSAIQKNKLDYADAYMGIFEAIINAKQTQNTDRSEKLLARVDDILKPNTDPFEFNLSLLQMIKTNPSATTEDTFPFWIEQNLLLAKKSSTETMASLLTTNAVPKQTPAPAVPPPIPTQDNANGETKVGNKTIGVFFAALLVLNIFAGPIAAWAVLLGVLVFRKKQPEKKQPPTTPSQNSAS